MKLNFSDKARDMVASFMDLEEDGPQALRIAVEGSPFAPNYELTLVDAATRAESDLEVDAGSFKVLVDGGSAERLNGATVDFVETIQESGFQITPDPDAFEGRRWTTMARAGELAERVSQVLDAEINPAIAAHGGEIKLRGRPGHRDLHRDGGGMPGVRDVADDAAAGRRAHGLAVRPRGHRDSRRDRPRERRQPVLSPDGAAERASRVRRAGGVA